MLDSRSIKSVKSAILPVKAITAALKHNNILKTIDLSKSNIRSEGGKTIAEALKSNATLTTINLSDNEIGSEGGKAIGEALKSKAKGEVATLELTGFK
ncbi:hypothetical protein BGZ46_002890 [Entomortierella lignicola]|nr:hypothetical protein BGZ46_002890 [Entomortierella lignicola]